MTILITGAAGTGKTKIVKDLKILHPEWAFTATTNLAASLFGGKTIQAYFKFKGDEWFGPDTIPHNKHKTIVIDEASMLSAAQLSLLKAARPNYNIILVGDFNQLLPVGTSAIRDLQIDHIFKMTFNHRIDKDYNLESFLKTILNSKTDLSFIKEHTITTLPEAQHTFITFTNKAAELNNNRFTLRPGDLVRARTWRFIEGKTARLRQTYRSDSRFTDRIAWFNNETFCYQKTYPYGIVEIYNSRVGLLSIPKWAFDDYFVTTHSATFHSVQGQTLENGVVVDLNSLNLMDDIDRGRAFYVACSRVRSAEKLWFMGTLSKSIDLTAILDLAAVKDSSQQDVIEGVGSMLCGGLGGTPPTKPSDPEPSKGDRLIGTSVVSYRRPKVTACFDKVIEGSMSQRQAAKTCEMSLSGFQKALKKYKEEKESDRMMGTSDACKEVIPPNPKPKEFNNYSPLVGWHYDYRFNVKEFKKIQEQIELMEKNRSN